MFGKLAISGFHLTPNLFFIARDAYSFRRSSYRLYSLSPTKRGCQERPIVLR